MERYNTIVITSIKPQYSSIEICPIKIGENFQLKLTGSMGDVMKENALKYRPYKTYHETFKKWKWLIYIFTKLGFFPLTFYKKYC